MRKTYWSNFVSGLRKLGDWVLPRAQQVGQTLSGNFPVTPRRKFPSEASLVLAHVGMLAVGITVFLTLHNTEVNSGYSSFQHQAYANQLLLLSALAGVIVYLAFRYPVLAWQISLLTATFGLVTVRGWDSWSMSFVLLLCAGLAVRICLITEAPFRYLVPAIGAGYGTLLGVMQASYGWFWLLPLTAFVVFIIDNHRKQSESTASQKAAEQAVAVAQKIAVTAQHEVMELGHREAVLRERTRIARDLHDVVAHHMSMVVVRAQTAEYRIADLSDEVKVELGEVAELARKSLTEVRELLTILRSDTEVALAPQPELEDVPELLEQARTSGMVVEEELAEPLPNLSVAASQAAYRVIQEGLANARRHAPGAPAEVLVLAQGRALVLSVRNGPPEVFSLYDDDDDALRADGELGASSAVGHGLLGLQERVHAVGGLLSAAETSDGGYLLFARLPLGEDAQ